MRRLWLDRYGVSLAILAVLAGTSAACLIWWVPTAARVHIHRLASDSQVDRSSAQAALVDLGPSAVPTLARFADDPDRRTRLGVAGALAEIGGEEGLRRLIPMLRDRDGEVRRRAAWALLRDGDVLARSGADLQIDEPDPVLRLLAIRLLKRRDLAYRIERCITALEDSQNLVRLAADRELRAVTGRSFEFEAFAEAPARAEAVARWRAWWQAERVRLPADSAEYRVDPFWS